MSDLQKQISVLKQSLGGVIDILGSSIKEAKKDMTTKDKETFDRWYNRAEQYVKQGDTVGLNNLKNNFK